MSDTPRPNSGQEGNNLPSAGDVEESLRKMDATPEATETLLLLLEHGRRNNLSQAQLAKFAKIDQSTLSKVFGGTYPAGIQGIAERVEAALNNHEEAQRMVERPIVQTWTLREIGMYCDATRRNETIGLLIGRSHLGKTTALEYHAQTHPRAVMMRMPAGGAARIFLQDLAIACGATARGAYDQVRRNVLNKFQEKGDNAPDLLIIDQAHETIVGRRVQTVTLGLILELHDLTGCPVVICATPAFADKMRDEQFRKFFEQLDNRAPLPRFLPDVPPMCDFDAIFAAYGLPPAPASKLHPADEKTPAEVVADLRAKNGLGKLIKLVREGRRVARNKQVRFGWSHMLDVVATAESWKAGDGPEDERDGREGR